MLLEKDVVAGVRDAALYVGQPKIEQAEYELA